MALFSWGKPSAPVVTNKVWKTSAARMKGMLRECLLAIKAGQTPVVIVWFSEARETLMHALTNAGMPTSPGVCVIDASKDLSSLNHLPSGPAAYFWLGRYPLSAREQDCINQVRVHHPEAPGHFCLSLEDAVFDVFAGQQLAPLLEKLGLRDDESIEHKLVDKAIDNALQKVSSTVMLERKATSEKQWFTLNYIAS